MQIIEKLYSGFAPLYPTDRFCDTDKALFIDIETTGLKKETTSLYLIGCGFYTDEGFMTRLFFADNESEEYDILQAFSLMIRDFTHMFHYNGLKFDIPYLEYKAGIHNINGLFDGIIQIDIYKLIKPLRYLLFSDTMRQKAVESFLCIDREDRYNGGELIDVYKRYTVTSGSDDLSALITHNREDVLGMHRIMPILYYLDLRNAPLEYKGYRINRYSDYSGEEHEEVIFTYSVPLSFPKSFSARTESMFIKASSSDRTISIRLPLISGNMKLYFDNYRDYCYLPDEDTAILRQIAQTLPRESYVKATKETCYQRVSGQFLKQPCSIFSPVLRTSYKDKKKYFAFPDSFKKEAADEFGRELLNVFFTMKKR